MKIDLSSYIPCSYEEAVEQVKTPRLLQHVAAPLVSFAPVVPVHFPSIWAGRTYTVKLKLFGLIPFGKQHIVISYPDGTGGFSLRDNGYGAPDRTWAHTITITQTPAGVLYKDVVAISAGLLTPVVWLYACFFYRHRQARWRCLAASGFAYSSKKTSYPASAPRLTAGLTFRRIVRWLQGALDKLNQNMDDFDMQLLHPVCVPARTCADTYVGILFELRP